MAVRSSDSEVFKRVSGAWVDQGYAMGYAMQTAARAYRNAAKTLGAAGSNNKVEFDSAAYDPGGNLVGLASADGTANKGRYVCPVAGYYLVTVRSAWRA